MTKKKTPTTKEALRATVVDIDIQVARLVAEGAPAPSLATLYNARANVLGKIARLEAEITERQIVTSAAWRRVLEAIEATLGSKPEFAPAAEALADRFEQMARVH